MELSKEQLQRVEHYLNVKGIDYVDIRMEVFDHIISDIETRMTAENLDFEGVFCKVTNKWNKQLKQESSFYFGILYFLPKIVLKKAKKFYRTWFFISFLTYLIPYIIISKTNFIFSESIEKELNFIFKIITFLTFVTFVFLFFIKLKGKKKTTYSFILKTQSWGLIFGYVILFDHNYVNEQGAINASNVAFLILFIFLTFIYFHFYNKHKEAIKKHQIS